MKQLKEDLYRYFFLSQCSSFWTKLKILILTQGIWAIIVYRIGHLIERRNWKFSRKPLMGLLLCFQKIIEIATGISISFSAEIGRGFYIGHFGGIFIHKDVRIGEYCNISQGVTIGLGGRGGNIGAPKIGNRVYIGPHAVVAGKIKIGDDVAIGANAVITESIPDKAVVIGVPGRIVNYKGSKDFIIFRKREK